MKLEILSMLNVTIRVIKQTTIAVNMNGVLVLASVILGIAQSACHHAVINSSLNCMYRCNI